MPVHVSYPGLYIEELPSSARSIVAAPTSITVFVGYVHPFRGECAVGGKWKKPFRVLNTDDYDRIFGGVYRNAILGDCDVGYAVQQFFANGGSDAIVVGLEPRYHEVGGTRSAPIEGATATLSGIKFTARELTDARHKIIVTVRNVHRRDPTSTTQPLDRADLMIAFGTRVETYRDVRVRTGPPGGYTNPSTSTFDPDFIVNKLKDSQLVKVDPADGTTEYPATYTIGGRQESVELIDLPPPNPVFAATTHNAQQFIEAFAADGPLDKEEIFNLLAIPGIADISVWNAGLAFCEDKRAMFIMDPPQLTAADTRDGLPEIREVFASDAIPKSSTNGAFYFPYLNTVDPVTGDTFEVPPSGFVAGVYARTDVNRGVWKAPAGLETTVLGSNGVVERGKMTDLRQGLLNPQGINVLRSFPGAGTVVWGARTIVAANPALEQWRYVPVRRMALFLEQTFLRNLGWVVFEPNDEPLWAAIRLSIESFMLSLFRQQAFQGSTPSEAFMVKCDKTTTTEQDIATGIVNIVVGFRPLKPAEFVIIKIAQLAGQVQA
jgi:uncharacterized protein